MHTLHDYTESCWWVENDRIVSVIPFSTVTVSVWAWHFSHAAITFSVIPHTHTHTQAQSDTVRHIKEFKEFKFGQHDECEKKTIQ